MNRRSIAATLAFLALVGTEPTWAQGNGNGNGQGSENGQGNDNGNAGGNGNGNAGGNANENAGGNGNSASEANGNSNAGGNGNGNNGGSQGIGNAGQNGTGDAAPGIGTVTTSPSSETPNAPSVPAASPELSESDVLAAVESGRAVALSTILPDIRSRTGGEVINAELQQVRGFLLYAVTVLTPTGKVSTEYYYALSGQHVEQ
ncbi:MAG: hypothetical protein JWQ22_3303 [Devosia sp.]|nr:hypothetical protein [Devosia sp.]